MGGWGMGYRRIEIYLLRNDKLTDSDTFCSIFSSAKERGWIFVTITTFSILVWSSDKKFEGDRRAAVKA
jgi:hypothetical protein